MIGSLKGVVSAIGEDAVLLDVNGVGYVAQAGSRTLSRLAVGEAAMLVIETIVREDSIKLFGFLSEEERGWFVHLQSVQSVGAKVAIAIIDTLTVNEMTDAISLQDKASFARANGVGPKLAARIVQELAGKAPPRGFLAHAPLPTTKGPVLVSGGAGARGEAVSALVNLGIDAQTAARAVATAMKSLEDPGTPELIRAALKEVRG